MAAPDHPGAPAALPIVPLINWRPLLAHARPSVFIIVLTPYAKRTTRGIANTLGTKDEKELDEIFKADWLTETRIAVRRRGDHLFIATTAHIIDFLYQADTYPISIAEVNRYFGIAVTCSHAESHFINGEFVGERTYTPATVCGIDCAGDLMMVRVDLRELAVRTVGERLRMPCTADHPLVQFSMNTREGTQCMLSSWPAYRPCTMAAGLQGQHGGPLSLMSTNPIGYDLHIMEASVGSETGSSRAPLYNTNQQVVGILHGGFGVHSYFIPSHYIVTFIDNKCVLPKSQGQQDRGKPSRRPGPLLETETTSAVQVASHAPPLYPPSASVLPSSTRPSLLDAGDQGDRLLIDSSNVYLLVTTSDVCSLIPPTEYHRAERIRSLFILVTIY